MKMPIELAASMPPNTAVPTSRRLICAAPVAMTSGSRPRMNAIDVIMTARKRICAPSAAASAMRHACLALLLGEFDDQNAVLRGERDQHDKADLGIKIERQTGEPRAP